MVRIVSAWKALCALLEISGEDHTIGVHEHYTFIYIHTCSGKMGRCR